MAAENSDCFYSPVFGNVEDFPLSLPLPNLASLVTFSFLDSPDIQVRPFSSPSSSSSSPSSSSSSSSSSLPLSSSESQKFEIQNPISIMGYCICCHLRGKYIRIGDYEEFYCANHRPSKDSGIKTIDLKRKCVVVGCNVIGSFCYPDNKSHSYCCTHRNSEMINLCVGKKCIFEGCTRPSCFGYPDKEGRIQKSHCYVHQSNDMEKVPRFCSVFSCIKVAKFGFPDRENERFYCKSHSLNGMEKVCIKHGCWKQIFRREGNRRDFPYCDDHMEFSKPILARQKSKDISTRKRKRNVKTEFSPEIHDPIINLEIEAYIEALPIVVTPPDDASPSGKKRKMRVTFY